MKNAILQRIKNQYQLNLNSDHGISHWQRYKEILLDITVGQLSNLVIACKSHSQSEIKPENITIATCWDADRLDLWRLGATPNPELLFSEYAKRKKSFEYSYRLNNSQTKSGTSP